MPRRRLALPLLLLAAACGGPANEGLPPTPGDAVQRLELEPLGEVTPAPSARRELARWEDLAAEGGAAGWAFRNTTARPVPFGDMRHVYNSRLAQELGKWAETRGRGDAWLRMTGNTEGSTDAFKARRLPPGRRPSTEWVRLGVGRVAPETDPVRDGGAGSAGDSGSGEASWRRRLAPRHRKVVREFFSD